MVNFRNGWSLHTYHLLEKIALAAKPELDQKTVVHKQTRAHLRIEAQIVAPKLRSILAASRQWAVWLVAAFAQVRLGAGPLEGVVVSWQHWPSDENTKLEHVRPPIPPHI